MRHVVSLCLAAGCGLSTPDIEPDPGGVTDPTKPPAADGVYRLRSHLDITAEALLPSQAEALTGSLRALSSNPAHAMITFADDAGVPAVGSLYGALPGPIQDRLEGWINDEIAKVDVDGVPVTEHAAQLTALIDTTLTGIELDSELALHGASATHRLTALDLSATGLDTVLPIGGQVGEVLTQEPTVVVARTGAVSLGAQHFGLNYGEYAWRAVDAAARAQHGGDLRERLGAAIDCPTLAHNVAARCVLAVCVGHQAELTSLCEGGLDAIVDDAHDRIAALRLEALHLAAGSATLVDRDGDGLADTLSGGVWQAEINLGLGLRHAHASFTGTGSR